jgi:xanthine dehydrogenase YagT iron-sulfur-binding subunit
MKDQSPRPRSGPGFDRRKFLRGSGAAAAATALATGPGLAEGQDEARRGAAVAPAEFQSIELKVNGKKVKLKVEPRMSLLEALRYQLGLTGAKPVSIDGSSGASTVLLDGKPVSANTVLAMQAVGHEVQTVEALADDAVPKAFVQADAQQCGFCTPGFVVAVRAFLTKHPKATEQQIREGLNGNLCRCGTYYDIIEAALAVVKGGARG